MNLIVHGLKTGQTNLARLLAQKLNLKFRDINDLIETDYFKDTGIKMPSRQILIELGLSLYKSLERNVLQSISHNHSILLCYRSIQTIDVVTMLNLRKLGAILHMKLLNDKLELTLLLNNEIPKTSYILPTSLPIEFSFPIDTVNDDHLIDNAANFILRYVQFRNNFFSFPSIE